MPLLTTKDLAAEMLLHPRTVKRWWKRLGVPPEIERVTRQGRSENLELLSSTQYPKDYARTIRESVTEWVCFNIADPDELDSVRPYFPGVDAVAELKRGEFISCNRETGAVMSGKFILAN